MDQVSLSNQVRQYLHQTLSRYWLENAEQILKLPISVVKAGSLEKLPPQTQLVSLPPWATDIGVNGEILVSKQFIEPGEGPAWTRTDWWNAAFWYLNGVSERTFEEINGPIHSYSNRLRGWDPRLWERAWINRIALFLRRWAAQFHEVDEQAVFGSLPLPEVILTHDVDALTKTMAIRLKQTAFLIYGSWRSLFLGSLRRFFLQNGRAVGFLFRTGDYGRFERITELERQKGLRGRFFFYGGIGGWRRTPKQALFDPAYSVVDRKVSGKLRMLHNDGWEIGLHQSFGAWADPALIREEKVRLEEALGAPVKSCRQHWLRFGWEHTWKAQEEAGLQLDNTLGFNDRPGFRNGAALRFHPWCPILKKPIQLEAIPTILMDSQLYNYRALDIETRFDVLNKYINEIKAVHGIACVLWHPHVLSPDYGWQPGFEELLKLI